jgi:hypothetical protein
MGGKVNVYWWHIIRGIKDDGANSNNNNNNILKCIFFYDITIIKFTFTL